MNLDVKIIAVLIGILLTVIISVCGYFYKSHDERKKSARKTLYFLLEIRYFIITSLFDPKEQTELLLKTLVLKLNERDFQCTIEELPKPLNNHIYQLINNIITSLREELITNLIQPYEENLIELSSINPVLAYTLRGRHKIEKLISHTAEYTQDLAYVFETSDDENQWFKEFVENSSTEILQKAKDDALNDFNEDIMLLAKFCGKSTVKRIEILLAQTVTFNSKQALKELDVTIDAIVNKMIEVQIANMQGDKDTHL